MERKPLKMDNPSFLLRHRNQKWYRLGFVSFPTSPFILDMTSQMTNKIQLNYNDVEGSTHILLGNFIQNTYPFFIKSWLLYTLYNFCRIINIMFKLLLYVLNVLLMSKSHILKGFLVEIAYIDPLLFLSSYT